MIRIQKLKQPKKKSGKEVAKGKSLVVDKVKITNLGNKPVFVDTYTRKPYKKKKINL